MQCPLCTASMLSNVPRWHQCVLMRLRLMSTYAACWELPAMLRFLFAAFLLAAPLEVAPSAMLRELKRYVRTQQ